MPSFRQVFLPYAIMRLGDGWFLLINREYKPLGLWNGWGNFDPDQAKIKIKGLTDSRAERLGLKIGGHCYYLYDDGSNPQASSANWIRYEAILARLMKLEVDSSGGGRPGRLRRKRRYVDVALQERVASHPGTT
jgi:hypothetical protein